MKHLLILNLLGILFISCERDEKLIDNGNNKVKQNTILPNGNIKEMNISPYISQYNYLGSGYDVTKKFADDKSTAGLIIDLDKFNDDYGLSKEKIYSQEYEEYYGENAIKYIKSYTKTRGGVINSNQKDSALLFGKTLSATLSNTKHESTTYDAKYIYGSYHILIKQNRFRFNQTIPILKNYLTSNFKESVKSLSPQDIVKLYGTHLLVDIFTGARMDMIFRAETNSVNRLEESKKLGALGLGILNISKDKHSSHQLIVDSYNKKMYYKTRGGDPSKSLVGNINLDKDNPRINIDYWQSSSTEDNSVLIDIEKDGLIPIYELIDDVILKDKLKSYIEKYLFDNRVQLYQEATPIYRYYNGRTGDHFYTTQINVPSFSGYILEGEAFRALTYKTDNTVPIYSYFNGTDHFYTQLLVGIPGYNLEGIAYYASLVGGNNLKPVYVYHHKKNGDNFYTTNFAELGSGRGRYSFKGIAFYVY